MEIKIMHTGWYMKSHLGNIFVFVSAVNKLLTMAKHYTLYKGVHDLHILVTLGQRTGNK